MHRRSPRRILATALATAALIVVSAGPTIGAPPGGTSKGITIVAQGLTGLGSFEVSGGQVVPIQIKISNEGKSTVNDVHLAVGKDNSPTTAANGDSTPPVALPDDVTLSAAGCEGGTLLTCNIGTLRSRGSVTFDVTVTTAEITTALAGIQTKATVTASEGGNDSGSNLDTFSIEGSLSVLPFSCESVTVYKPGADKTASTCSLTDTRNANGQSAIVTLPSRLITATVKEVGEACPPVAGLSCIGDVVEADIAGDTTGDVVTWTLAIAGVGSVNLNKLVVYHYNDAGALTDIIPLTKKNACKTASATNCGTATLIDGVLTITVQTGGNGKIRGFG